MNVIIVGGTGFLGYHSTLEFLRHKHQVTVLALPDIELGDWFPKEVEVKYANIFKMTLQEMKSAFSGFDALVYAVGPDDRVTPKAPAHDFFHTRLVEACGTVVAAAREAGVKRCVVLSSYFVTMHRMKPEKKLADHHPYIRCRIKQTERVISEGKDTMDVMVLELPFIFGVMPERIPLWNDVLFERLRKPKWILFPQGGSNMIAVENVAEAVVGAVERGQHGQCYPIGDGNLTWDEMIGVILSALGQEKSIIHIPQFLAVLYGRWMKILYRMAGKEAGLDPVRLMRDIMTDTFFFDPAKSREDLEYGSGGLEEAIRQTVRACYLDLD